MRLIGRYQEVQVGVPSTYYLRWFFVDRLVHIWEIWVGSFIKNMLEGLVIVPLLLLFICYLLLLFLDCELFWAGYSGHTARVISCVFCTSLLIQPCLVLQEHPLDRLPLGSIESFL